MIVLIIYIVRYADLFSSFPVVKFIEYDDKISINNRINIIERK